MESTPGKRLQQWREFKGISLTEMFRATGVKVTTLSTAESPGASNPSYDTITKVLAAYPDLSPDWLLMGAGAMLRDGRALTPAPRAAEPAPDFTTAAGTQEAVVTLLLKEQLAEAREQARADRALIAWLQGELGKLPGSADAAAPASAPAPRPRPIGFVPARIAARFEAYVQARQPVLV